MVANVLPADPPPLTKGMGPEGKNSTFSEHGHVAYQIKENHEYNNMVANILLHTPPTLGIGSVGLNLTISENSHVAYQIKENHKCMLPADPPPPTPLPSGWVSR